MGLTVEESLQLPGLDGTSVAAGAAGPGRVVRHMVVDDPADPLAGAGPDVLVVLGARLPQADPANCRALVERLDPMGTAALAYRRTRARPRCRPRCSPRPTAAASRCWRCPQAPARRGRLRGARHHRRQAEPGALPVLPDGRRVHGRRAHRRRPRRGRPAAGRHPRRRRRPGPGTRPRGRHERRSRGRRRRDQRLAVAARRRRRRRPRRADAVPAAVRRPGRPDRGHPGRRARRRRPLAGRRHPARARAPRAPRRGGGVRRRPDHGR